MAQEQKGQSDYEPPQLFVIGTVTELTQVGAGNPKIGPYLDGNNQNQLGKTSIWP